MRVHRRDHKREHELPSSAQRQQRHTGTTREPNTARLYIPSSGRMVTSKLSSFVFPSGKKMVVVFAKLSSEMSAERGRERPHGGVRAARHAPRRKAWPTPPGVTRRSTVTAAASRAARAAEATRCEADEKRLSPQQKERDAVLHASPARRHRLLTGCVREPRSAPFATRSSPGTCLGPVRPEAAFAAASFACFSCVERQRRHARRGVGTRFDAEKLDHRVRCNTRKAG